MSHGKGKAKRRSSVDDRHRLDSSSATDLPLSAPSSSFDASIPFNLPPRRSMKMLKDGSDYVWPEAAHSLFVRGLQTWKFMHIGSKRTRAPRGEGKTDFLVRYLETHGVERTKKQVASHLQVLRTEWRNSDNTLLLSLVDDTVPHTRSLSEPSALPSSPSEPSPSTSFSSYSPVPDHGDDRAISTPSLPSPISALPPAPSSSLYHPAHDIYSSPTHTYPEDVSGETFHTEPGSNIGSWQPDDTAWSAAAASGSESYPRPTLHHPVPSYDPPSTFHDYDPTPRPIRPSPPERRFSSDYRLVSGRSDTPSSNVAAPLARISHPLPTLPLDTGGSSYPVYTPPSYPIPQAAIQPHEAYGAAYATEAYHAHYGGAAVAPMGSGIAASSGSPYNDPPGSSFLADAQVQQPQRPQPQPHPHTHWARSPATSQFPRPPSEPGHHGSSQQ